MLIGMFSHYFFGIAIFVTSIFLVLLVLVQRGRGGGLVGALGGPGGQSALGTKAGDVFTRITIVVAAIWIFLCASAVRLLNPSSSNPLSGLDEPASVSSDPGMGTTSTTPSPTGSSTTPAATTPAATTPAATTPAASTPATAPATGTPTPPEATSAAPAVTPATPANPPAATTPEQPAAAKPTEPAPATPAPEKPAEPAAEKPTEEKPAEEKPAADKPAEEPK